MAGWRCFLAHPVAFAQKSLRRYSSSAQKCSSKFGYHNAEVVIDPELSHPFNDTDSGEIGPGSYTGDPRWPRACICGYVFHPEDHWQVVLSRLFEGSLDKALYTLRAIPPGAIWHAWWMDDLENYHGPDGKVWALQMPCMIEWLIFGPSADGKRWEVDGILPAITVRPSINLQGAYHGHVSAGVIGEDVEQRTFDSLKRTA